MAGMVVVGDDAVMVESSSNILQTITRALVGLVLAAAAVAGGAALTWIGVIEYTGCFIECHTPDPNVLSGWSALTGAGVCGGITSASLAWGFTRAGRSVLTRVFLAGIVAAILVIGWLLAPNV